METCESQAAGPVISNMKSSYKVKKLNTVDFRFRYMLKGVPKEKRKRYQSDDVERILLKYESLDHLQQIEFYGFIKGFANNVLFSNRRNYITGILQALKAVEQCHDIECFVDELINEIV